MLKRQPFYYNTIRKVTVAFGTIFNDLTIHREDQDGNLVKEIPVPLQYTTKEKFVKIINEPSKTDGNLTQIQETLPRMGFEMTSLTYAPERKTNTMQKIIDKDSPQAKYMYNRVPYDIGFSLYIATRKLDDSFRIVEQILPYFTPELTVKIIDKGDYGIETNVPFNLVGTNFEVDSEGTFDERRTIAWSLDFTAKIYLYAATNDTGLIKKTVVDINNPDTQQFIEQYTATVDPLAAGASDDYTINESVTTDNYYDSLMTGSNGSVGNVDLTD